MKKVLSPNIKRFSAAKQRRLDELLEKNSEGTITPAERVRLEQLVAKAEELMVANAERVAQLSQSAGPPADAMPVTVWVVPESTGR
jgi:hypothetical protein